MELVLQIIIGIGLAATCGFRVFVPLLVMSIAGLSGYLQLGTGFEWIASYPALIVFGIATLIEIAAYFFPYVDNILNAVSIPAAIIAGVIVTASVITDINPILQWSLAIIAGGGAATATSLISNGTHLASTAVSGGAANPAVSTVESAAAVVTAILSIVVPVLAFVLLILLIVIAFRTLRRMKEKRARRLRRNFIL